MKKIIALVLALVLTVAASVAGTVAYLQAEDSDVNVMTLGNVKIAQHEFERVVDANGNYTTIEVDGIKSYELKDFSQGKPLYPFVGAVDKGYDPIPVRLAQLGHNSRGGMDVLPAANVQDKFVVVENTGSSDAYVRTIVAFEAGSVAEEDWYKLVSYSAHFTWKETQDWFVTEIDGNNYYLVEFVYNGYENVQHPNGVLTPGDYTYNSLAQVYMFDTATNEDVEALDGNDNGTFDIIALSQAVQTKGFADAKTALDTAFGEFNEANVKTWFAGKEAPVLVSTADELTEALKVGGRVVLNGDVELTETVNIEKAANIDLNGHNLTVTVLEAKADTTISNGTVTHGKSTYPALSVSAGTLQLDNVDVVCNEYCNLVTSGSAEAAEYAGIEVWSGKLVLNDSTITVSTDKIRYSNSIFAIGIHAGEVTMNGGSITVTSHGSSRPQYDYQGVIFAGSAAEKSVTLNNVSINIGSGAKYLFAWGGHTTLNTTDTVTDEDVHVNGGTYTIQ